MTDERTQIRCPDCDWTGALGDRLIAANPWQDGETIDGCPLCREPVEFRQLCDESGCMQDATCGTPSSQGYRRCCGKHYEAIQQQIKGDPE